MLNFEKLANEMQIKVCSAHLTIRDRRTGETFVMDFYRPGDRFPMEAVDAELSSYGYEIVNWAKPDPTTANIDWSVIYHSINRHDFTLPPVEERARREA